MRSESSERETPAAELVTARIRELGDWRGEQLALVRRLIHEAAPAILEEWKWRGTPVWSHHGIVCTAEAYKQTVKLTFAKGAFLGDPTICSTRGWGETSVERSTFGPRMTSTAPRSGT